MCERQNFLHIISTPIVRRCEKIYVVIIPTSESLDVLPAVWMRIQVSGMWHYVVGWVVPDILKDCGTFIVRGQVSHLRRPGSLNILIVKLVTSLFFWSISHTVVNALIVVFILFRTVVALLLIWNMRLFSCNVLVHRGNVSSKCYIDLINIIVIATIIAAAAAAVITTSTMTTTTTTPPPLLHYIVLLLMLSLSVCTSGPSPYPDESSLHSLYPVSWRPF